MRVPLSWLRNLVDVPWSGKELGSRLTMSGFELEALDSAAPSFSGVVIAEIVEAARHPQADKLQVCKVRAGGTSANDDTLQIVCGAANARVGLKTALAIVGAKLPGDKAILAAKLRGVESFGMLCSAKELGLSDTSEGILELPADAPVGTELRAWLDLDDAILELNVTPNRGDAMSILGIAREVAALTRGAIAVPGEGTRRARPPPPPGARKRLFRCPCVIPRAARSWSAAWCAASTIARRRHGGCANGCDAPACGPSARWSTSRST
jgi:phenylalanyl-tRNA synthetase beta chain